MSNQGSWLDTLINTPDRRRADLAEGIALAVSETIHAEAQRVRAVRLKCAERVASALAEDVIAVYGVRPACGCGRPCICF